MKRLQTTEYYKIDVSPQDFALLKGVVLDTDLVVAVRGKDFEGEGYDYYRHYQEFWHQMVEQDCELIKNKSQPTGWSNRRFIAPKDICVAISILNRM